MNVGVFDANKKSICAIALAGRIALNRKLENRHGGDFMSQFDCFAIC